MVPHEWPRSCTRSAAEMSAEGIELPNEVIDGKERGVGGAVRLAAAELVVPDHRAIVAQRFERFEVVAGVPRTAVQQDHRGPGAGAGDPVPDPSTVHRQHPLAGGQGRAVARARRRAVATREREQQREGDRPDCLHAGHLASWESTTRISGVHRRLPPRTNLPARAGTRKPGLSSLQSATRRGQESREGAPPCGGRTRSDASGARRSRST